MMADTLRLFRQAPGHRPHRCLSLSPSLDVREVENRPYPLPDAPRRFRNSQPYLNQTITDMPGVDIPNQHIPEIGESVILKGTDPLLTVFLVLPCRKDFRIDHMRRLSKGRHSLLLFLSDRINSAQNHLANSRCSLSGLRQRHVPERAKAVVPALASVLHSEYPAFSPVLTNDQEQTAPVHVFSGLRVSDLKRRKLPHTLPHTLLRIYTNSGKLLWTMKHHIPAAFNRFIDSCGHLETGLIKMPLPPILPSLRVILPSTRTRSKIVNVMAYPSNSDPRANRGAGLGIDHDICHLILVIAK